MKRATVIKSRYAKNSDSQLKSEECESVINIDDSSDLVAGETSNFETRCTVSSSRAPDSNDEEFRSGFDENIEKDIIVLSSDDDFVEDEKIHLEHSDVSNRNRYPMLTLVEEENFCSTKDAMEDKINLSSKVECHTHSPCSLALSLGVNKTPKTFSISNFQDTTEISVNMSSLVNNSKSSGYESVSSINVSYTSTEKSSNVKHGENFLQLNNVKKLKSVKNSDTEKSKIQKKRTVIDQDIIVLSSGEDVEKQEKQLLSAHSDSSNRKSMLPTIAEESSNALKIGEAANKFKTISRKGIEDLNDRIKVNESSNVNKLEEKSSKKSFKTNVLKSADNANNFSTVNEKSNIDERIAIEPEIIVLLSDDDDDDKEDNASYLLVHRDLSNNKCCSIVPAVQEETLNCPIKIEEIIGNYTAFSTDVGKDFPVTNNGVENIEETKSSEMSLESNVLKSTDNATHQDSNVVIIETFSVSPPSSENDDIFKIPDNVTKVPSTCGKPSSERLRKFVCKNADGGSSGCSQELVDTSTRETRSLVAKWRLYKVLQQNIKRLFSNKSGSQMLDMNSSYLHVLNRICEDVQQEMGSKLNENEIEWTVNAEVLFLYSMIGHKPVGVNKNFMMILIHNKFSAYLNHQIYGKVLWDHLDSMYDMAALHESEIIPFPNDDVEYELPEDCYELLQSKHGVSLKKSDNENELNKNSTNSVKTSSKKLTPKLKPSNASANTPKSSFATPVASKPLKSQTVVKSETKTPSNDATPKLKVDSGSSSTKTNKIKRSSSPFATKLVKSEPVSVVKEDSPDISGNKKIKSERSSSPAVLKKPVKTDSNVANNSTKKPIKSESNSNGSKTPKAEPSDNAVKKVKVEKDQTSKKGKVSSTPELPAKKAKVDVNGVKKKNETESSSKKVSDSSSSKQVKAEGKSSSHSSRTQEVDTPTPSGSRKSSPVVKVKNNDSKKHKRPKVEDSGKKSTPTSKRRRP